MFLNEKLLLRDDGEIPVFSVQGVSLLFVLFPR